jgi:AraC family transcriptional regulator
MQLRSLIRSFNKTPGTTPAVYDDHFLFSDELGQPYSCKGHISGMGILIAQKGYCRYAINGTNHQVSDTQVLFVNSGSKLAITVTDPDAVPALLFFKSHFPAQIDFSYLERVHEQPFLHQAVSSLITLGDGCSSFAALQADIVIRNLFEDMIRESQHSHQLSQNLNTAKASTRLEVFKQVSATKEWMEAHYHSNIDLEKMAGIACMNSQHFLRMFRQVYRITPHQYLKELRLKKAKDLLASTPLPIGEICRSVGFESVFSFSLLFKSRFGFPPTQARKN